MDRSDIIVKLSSKRLDHVIDRTNLGFGNVFADHIFVMDYSPDLAWHDPRIVPYGPMSMDPAAMIFHYGQGVFEGLKSYRTEDDKIVLFRPLDYFDRLNNSCNLLCIPKLNKIFLLEALKKLLTVEKNWIPNMPMSLYIRPTLIATEGALGVRPADFYRFFIILSPVSAYYAEGLSPIKIKVSKEHIRVAKGSVGEAKTIGNYAAGLFASREAKQKGFTQVLWLDSVERKYVEEVGVMNIFFVIDDKLITPKLSGSILPGITRDSIIKLADFWSMKVVERKISINEIFNAYSNGTLKEAFGTGTAVVVSPIGSLELDNYSITINDGKVGPIAQKFYDVLTNIQSGKLSDNMNWLVDV